MTFGIGRLVAVAVYFMSILLLLKIQDGRIFIFNLVLNHPHGYFPTNTLLVHDMMDFVSKLKKSKCVMTSYKMGAIRKLWLPRK